MSDILDLILKWLVPFMLGGIVSLVSMLISQVKKERKREKLLEEGLCALLRAEVVRQYEKWTERGYIPLYAIEALKKEYKVYHELGGNDVATNLYEKLKELPTEPPKNV